MTSVARTRLLLLLGGAALAQAVAQADCASGRFYKTSETKCVNCPQGYTQSLPGQISCDTCAAGTYMETQLSTAPSCKDCPIGKYQHDVANTEAGLTDCMACPHGYGQELPKQSSCDPCVAGRYAEGGDASGRVCTDCPVGKFAVTTQTNCQVCNQGFGSAPSYRATSCESCTAGVLFLHWRYS